MEINLDILDISIGLVIALVSGISYLFRQRSQYNLASKNMEIDINGIWYSAELDFKQNELSNAYLQVKIKRKKLGNKILIKPIKQMNLDDVQYETSWLFYGKILPNNTIMGEYIGQNDHSLGVGHGFLRFIGNGRAVGHWLGYSGKFHGQIMYGYWVLSKNKEDLISTANFILGKFQYYDVKYLVEHQNDEILPKDYLKKNN